MSDVAILEPTRGVEGAAEAEPVLDPALGGDAEFQSDLISRLEEVDRDDYDDPARRELTRLDWLAIVAFVVGVSAVAFAWGY